MAMCCAHSEVSVRSKLPPRARPTTSVIALGKRNCGVTLGGALGFLLTPVRPLLSHPLTRSASAITGAKPIFVESLICSSHSVRIERRSWRDVDEETETACRWKTGELNSLDIAVVERRFRIDVWCRGVHPQVTADES